MAGFSSTGYVYSGWATLESRANGTMLAIVSDDRPKAAAGSEEKADLELLKKAERVLSEIDRTAGLIDRHADVLAALRIRIEGGPRKSLEELMEATGSIAGKRAKELTEKLAAEESRKRGDLGDLLAREPKKKASLDDLLGSE
jgi:hypothetical protein